MTLPLIFLALAILVAITVWLFHHERDAGARASWVIGEDDDGASRSRDGFDPAEGRPIEKALEFNPALTAARDLLERLR